ncbi:MAG: ankyrin repeat domain-containing protein [Bacteroidota bacterium]
MKIVKYLVLLLFSFLTISYSQAQKEDSISRLLIAVQKNDLATVKKLVEAGEPVNYEFIYGDDALTYAVYNDYREIAKYLLANGAKSREGFNAAVRTGDLAWVKFLIGYGYFDYNAMVPAVETNNLELVNYLISLDFPVNVDEKRKSGIFRSYQVSPLGVAIGKNDAMVLSLVKAGADMEEAFNYCTNTNPKLGKQLIDLGVAVNQQYLWSLRDGDKLLMEYALKKGADPNYTDEKGYNAYLHAVSNENLKAMRYCIDTLKLSVNSLTADGETDLILAVRSENRAVIDVILARNPDLEAVDHVGNTALYEAALRKNLELMGLLIEKGADLNHQNNYGYTPFLAAVAESDRKEQVARVLLKDYPDLKLKTTAGNNVLSYFYDDRELNMEFITELISLGADPNVRAFSDGGNLAFIAIDRDNLELLKKVKEMGLPTDGTDNDGHRAHCKDLEIIRFVLENGGKIDRRDPWRKTYLDDALDNNDVEFGAYLISKGANVNGEYSEFDPILFEAIAQKNLAFVELLVENGVDLFFENPPWNENAMEEAAKVANSGSLESIAIVNYLRSKGAMTKEELKNMEIGRSKEMESFEKWIADKDVEALNGLLTKYTMPFLTKDQVKKAAQLSAETGSFGLLQICMERYRWNINDPLNFEGQTLLHIAAKNNQLEMAILLTNKGADANKLDSLSKLPLAYAKKKGLKNHLKEAMKKVD